MTGLTYFVEPALLLGEGVVDKESLTEVLKHNLKELIFNTITVLLSFIPVIIPRRNISKWSGYIISMIYSVLLLTEWLHISIYWDRLNSPAFYAIFSTNQMEVSEYVANYFTLIPFAILSSVAVLLYLFYKWIGNKKWSGFLKLAFTCISFLLYAIFSLTHPSENYFRESVLVKPLTEFANYQQDLKLLSSPCKNQAHFLEGPTGSQVHIILIGESTSKYHMSLYDYGLPTTPRLDELRDSLLIFDNAKSPIVHSIDAIKSFLLLDSCNSILEQYAKAGFKTIWISNQNYLGENETPITALAKRTQKQIWLSPSGRMRYDEVVLPNLETQIDSGQMQIIFVHLAGAHLDYYKRYPPEYRFQASMQNSPFGPRADQYISHYNSAIYYQDFVISEIIKLTEKLNIPATVTYFSDHGEEVYDERNFHGHSQVRLSRYMTNIPYFIYSNRHYRKDQSSHWKYLKDRRPRPIEIGQFKEILQSLIYQDSLRFDSVIDVEAEVNPFSLKTQYELPNYKDKIWVHRVNSPSRFSEVNRKFYGFELDLSYINGDVFVLHHGNKEDGTLLIDYFNEINDPDEKYWWFDLKNADENNIGEFVRELAHISKSHFTPKMHILVETTEPSLIPAIESNGFYASYYLPNLIDLADSKRSEVLEICARNISENEISTISQSIDNYELMKVYFPRLNRAIWTLNFDFSEGDIGRLDALFRKDSLLKVCLVNYETGSWE
jgi:heptose-I-phosphate ethanolaminephosphotransferase